MMMLKPRPRQLTLHEEAERAVPATAAAPAAMQQAQTLGLLLAQSFARSAANGAATAALLPLALRPAAGPELLELQFAVLQRLQQLQQDWWQGWTAWLDEFGQLRRANTLSEHLEQNYNLCEQFAALLKSQASDLTDLQENLEVDYGYWVAQQVEALPRE